MTLRLSREELAELAAVRELMNTYNLGGWTDAVAPMQRALKAEAKCDALIGLLDGFTGNAPSPLQWKLACEKAAELRAAIATEGRVR